MMTKPHHYLLFSVLVGLIFALILVDLSSQSIWHDEAWTAWLVYDDVPQPDGIRQTLGFIVDSVLNVFQRTQHDVHPPLYYMFMDVWTMLFGESVFVLRLPSAFFGLLSLAFLIPLSKRLFDSQTGFIALIILATSPFFMYYTREARMYTLFLAVLLSSTWIYLLWTAQPSRKNTLAYGISVALMLWTHYLGFLILLGHVAHLVITRRFHLRRVGAYLIVFIGFAPWLPFAFRQLQNFPNGPLGTTTATLEWETITWLWDMLTVGQGGLFFIAFLLGSGLWQLRPYRSVLLLCLLWFILTPIILIIGQLVGFSLLVLRYFIGIVPAFALISAYGIRHIATSPFERIGKSSLRWVLPLIIITLIVIAQLSAYAPNTWINKPPWNESIQRAIAERNSELPAIIDLPARNVASYYDRQLGLRRGISIDIGWVDFVPETIHGFVDTLSNAESIWLIAPSNRPQTWDALFQLRRGRTVGYRDTVMLMTFYRFDMDESVEFGDLDFAFYELTRGPVLSYDSGIGHRYYANIGNEFCTELKFTALQSVSDGYRLLVWLTQGFNTTRTEWSGELPSAEEGDVIALQPCLPIPDDAPRGPYHMRLLIQSPAGQSLVLVEGAESLYWGEFLIPAWVSVDK